MDCWMCADNNNVKCWAVNRFRLGFELRTSWRCHTQSDRKHLRIYFFLQLESEKWIAQRLILLLALVKAHGIECMFSGFQCSMVHSWHTCLTSLDGASWVFLMMRLETELRAGKAWNGRTRIRLRFQNYWQPIGTSHSSQRSQWGWCLQWRLLLQYRRRLSFTALFRHRPELLIGNVQHDDAHEDCNT